MFIHTVFFYLTPTAPPSARDQLLNDCRTLLSRVPHANDLHAGPPAMTPHDVVDNSYAVALTICFPDKPAHDAYQSHPLHHDFIARNEQHWARVQVYDYLT